MSHMGEPNGSAHHPLYKLKPKKVDWAVWIKGSFVYPQYQVIHENKTAKK